MPQRKPRFTPARRIVFRPGERLEGVPVVADGWAACFSRLPDGSRQILSFLLPGDLISANAVFSDRLSFFVEALTDLQCLFYDRTELADKLVTDPRMVGTLIKSMLTKKENFAQLAIDLGRRSARERVARLILYLKRRLEARNLVVDNSFDMPLRQQHIADATGLTAVHVNRVLGTLRSEGVVDFAEGKLRIADLALLQQAADPI